MNSFQLFTEDGKPTGVWACGKCHNVHHSKAQADRCKMRIENGKTCTPYLCEVCGKEVEGSWLKCESCRAKTEAEAERKRFDASEKLTAWDGWIYAEGFGFQDGFFPCLEDFMDEFTDPGEGPRVDTNGEEMPNYVWTCNPVQYVALCIDTISDSITSDAPEDFVFSNLEGLKELEAALDAFNKVNEDKVWYEPDYTKSVMINS